MEYFDSLSQELKQKLTLLELEGLLSVFKGHEKAGVVDAADFSALCSSLSQKFGAPEVFNKAFAALKKPSLTFSELVNLFVLSESARKKERVTQKGAGGAIHSFSEEEKKGYVEYINSTLSGEDSLEGVIPINTDNLDLFSAVAQGVLLCKLINRGFPKAINETKLRVKPINDYQKNENHDLCIQGALDIGCSVVNIGGKDLLQGTPHLVLGLVWQIIKKSLLAQVAANLQAESTTPIDMPPEQMLLKWFNFHLANSGSTRTISNWSSDLKDSELYAILLSQLEPKRVGPSLLSRTLEEEDLHSRAEIVLSAAEQLGCRKFVTPNEIVQGNPRLNLAFVATLFNSYPHMGPTAEEKRLKELEVKLDEAQKVLKETGDEKESLVKNLQRRTEDLDQKSQQLDEVSLKLAEALASKDHLSTLNTRLEGMLEAQTKENAAFAAEIESLSSEKDKLSNQLDEEKNSHERTRGQLSETEGRLAAAEAEALATQKKLQSQLDEERRQREETERILAKLQEEFAEAKNKHSQREADLLRQLAEERAAKEALALQLAEALKEKEELAAKLRDETQLRQNLEEELRETEDELEELRAESDEEKTLLLQRIKDLEEELEQLKALMESSLDKATREKAEALMAAARAKEQALSEAEQARIAQLRKVQGLLSKVQREGFLHVQEKGGVLGTTKWRKRYFVLQDHFLSYYKDKKALEVASPKPLGIIFCEQCRVYEIDSKEAKRQFCFQLDTGKQHYNLAADKPDEMKNWMKDIKEAKKKAIGVEVVAGNEPASPRNN